MSCFIWKVRICNVAIAVKLYFLFPFIYLFMKCSGVEVLSIIKWE